MLTKNDIPDMKYNIITYLDPDYKDYDLIIRSMTFVNNHGHISHEFYDNAWEDVSNGKI